MRLLAGTDAGGVPFVLPGISMHDELGNLVSAGLSPYEALRTATVAAAEFLGASERSGTIAPGKNADFVLLRGNPIRDINSVRLIGGVMMRGEWFPQDRLRAMLEAVVRVNEHERRFFTRIERDGLAPALAAFEVGDMREERLNEFGYQTWLLDEDLESALLVFQANARVHPESWRAHESLGKALDAVGRSEEAAGAYERARRMRESVVSSQ